MLLYILYPSSAVCRLPRCGTVNMVGHREEMSQPRSNIYPFKGRVPCMAERGSPTPVNLLRYLAWMIVYRQSSTFHIPASDDGVQAPGKHWSQDLYNVILS